MKRLILAAVLLCSAIMASSAAEKALPDWQDAGIVQRNRYPMTATFETDGQKLSLNGVWKFQRLDVISLSRLSGNGPHLAWRQNLLDFLELRQVLSTYDGDLRDPLWWPQERPVPIRVARGPLRVPLPSMPGPKTLVGVGAGR